MALSVLYCLFGSLSLRVRLRIDQDGFVAADKIFLLSVKTVQTFTHKRRLFKEHQATEDFPSKIEKIPSHF